MKPEKKIPIPEYIDVEYRKLEALGWIESPSSIIRNARETYIFNCLLADAIGHQLITPAMFREEIPVHTGGPGITIRKRLTEQDLVAARWNNALLALGATSLAVDKAMDATFGSKNPEDTSDLGSARAIMYQIRNAFAHDLFNPRWVIKAKYQRRYQVTIPATYIAGEGSSLTIEFDGAAVDGQRIKPEHHGGLEGYIMLLEFCLAQVERSPRGKEKYTSIEDE